MFWDSNADSKTLGPLKISTWSLYLDFNIIFSCWFSTAAEDSPSHPFEKGYEFEVQAVHLPFRAGWELHLLTALLC